ncbi:RDD family protein [Formosa maritima]|uniref:RDD family protein n=1 Tax=Formosa maritima TaxID=2592046 RepID=A0A5D0G3R9_9FLAO|nr:RDD family protein [Formosa maritima]TYA53793.1 RDD family protein [Formosa maritima]
MLLIKRLIAALIDYLIILLYGFILFTLTTTIYSLDNLTLNINPINGQLIGFISLTLPVFLYFYFMESSKLKASLGKMILKIQVDTKKGSILKRNIFKFLPWEIAHIGVHFMFHYNSIGSTEPVWIWIILILPQIIALLYFLSILYTKGNSSIYDYLAKTCIKIKI